MANYTNHRRSSDLPIRCDTCYYCHNAGKYSLCQYILLAGVSRDCPADENCTKYINKKRKKEKDKMASRINWTPKLDAEVDQLRADGWKWDKIGGRLGCTGKAVSVRYYKRRKPVHTPAPKQERSEAVRISPEQDEPEKAEVVVETGAIPDELGKRAELHTIHGDLDLHAEHIATLAGLLRLVCTDAESGKENYDALMSRLDILLDSLTEATEMLDTAAERLGKEILNRPQSGNSTAD